MFISCFFFGEVKLVTCPPQTNLFSVQRCADCNFTAARVNRELLLKVSAHYRVPQQIINRTILICGCYLKEKEQGGGMKRFLLDVRGQVEIRQRINMLLRNGRNPTEQQQRVIFIFML